MSRFYDAMKKSGQALPFQEDLAPEPPSSLPELPATPEHLNVANNSLDFETVPPQGDSLSGALEVEIAQLDTGRRNGKLGTAVDAAVPRKVRLIPNIEDRVVIEQYRLLRTKLLQQRQERMFKTVLITSPAPREGKTLTTTNLALTFGLLPNFKVLIVEGDLRRGTLGELIDVGPRPGFSDLILGRASMDEVILRPESIPVSFMTKGNNCETPAELLHSSQLGSVFQQLANAFDLVLVDSPPVNLVTDAQILASHCDGILLVARAFATSRKALENAVHALQPHRILGSVLNAGTRLSPYFGYSSYGSYY